MQIMTELVSLESAAAAWERDSEKTFTSVHRDMSIIEIRFEAPPSTLPGGRRSAGLGVARGAVEPSREN